MVRPASDRARAPEDCHRCCPLVVTAFRNDSAIRARVGSALDLIADHAPAEFRRITTLMRGIIVTHLHRADGEWRQSLNTCLISARFIKRKDATPESVAGTIIHELTHARLEAIGFDYRDERRARIERICYRRSQRFLESLPTSNERTAALEDAEAGLSLDSDQWRAVFSRRQQPWYARVLQFLLVRMPALLRRSTRI